MVYIQHTYYGYDSHLYVHITPSQYSYDSFLHAVVQAKNQYRPYWHWHAHSVIDNRAEDTNTYRWRTVVAYSSKVLTTGMPYFCTF